MDDLEYVKQYDSHHLAMGKAGSGSGSLDFKLDMISAASLSGSCLDYGCGWGQLSCAFDDYAGLDISLEAIKLARVINPGKDFYVIPHEFGRQFDFGVCLSVLTHTQVPKRVLSDLFKYVPVALIDIIKGDGGNWQLQRRNEDVFNGYDYKFIGTNTSRYGIEHSYYKVERATGE